MQKQLKESLWADMTFFLKFIEMTLISNKIIGWRDFLKAKWGDREDK